MTQVHPCVTCTLTCRYFVSQNQYLYMHRTHGKWVTGTLAPMGNRSIHRSLMSTVQIIQVQVHKCIEKLNNCGLAGVAIPESIPVPPQNLWEIGHRCYYSFPMSFPPGTCRSPVLLSCIRLYNDEAKLLHIWLFH